MSAVAWAGIAYACLALAGLLYLIVLDLFGRPRRNRRGQPY